MICVKHGIDLVPPFKTTLKIDECNSYRSNVSDPMVCTSACLVIIYSKIIIIWMLFP